MISKSHSKVSITKQCHYLGINRSGLYKERQGESPLNLELMELIDKHYLDHPYKGARRMYVYLTKDLGYRISLNRIERLYYKVMGLQSMLPGPHTSKRGKDHVVYPYLLRGVNITQPNQVWATDISYVGIRRGYMYLTAIIDLFSRYVVGWSISNTMDAAWCIETLEQAMEQFGTPQILNTDQGAQYTSQLFTQAIIQKNIQLSMDGRGRATDNAFIERLWRSIKYEKLYLYKPQDGLELYSLTQEYFQYYNHQRRHSSIDDLRPGELYLSKHSQPYAKTSLQHYNTFQNVF